MADQVIVGGPAGSGKSVRVARTLGELGSSAVASEWTRLWAAIRLVERDAEGRFPVRTPSAVDGLITQIRRDVVNQAVRRDLPLVVSTGSRIELEALRAILPRAEVQIIDTSEDQALANLQQNYPNEPECPKAVARWLNEPDETFDPHLYWFGRRRQ